MNTPRRRLGAVAAGAGIAMLPWAAMAAVGEAPTASAQATAAQVDDLLAIGSTTATAPAPADGEPAASGNAVAVGGRPLTAATGGSQEGPGRSEGRLFDTGDSGVGRVTATPWSAEVTDDGEQRQATGTAALLRLYLVEPTVLDLTVLGSTSTATHDGATSSGSASTDAAVLDLFDVLRLELLHSEAASDGSSTSYLASLNGTEIGSSDSFHGCSIDVPDLVALACLQAGGGAAADPAATDPAATEGSAQVLGAELVRTPAASVATTASTGGVSAASASEPAGSEGLAPSTGDVARNHSPGRGSLATTGTDAVHVGLAGIAVLLLGLCMRGAARLSPPSSRATA